MSNPLKKQSVIAITVTVGLVCITIVAGFFLWVQISIKQYTDSLPLSGQNILSQGALDNESAVHYQYHGVSSIPEWQINSIVQEVDPGYYDREATDMNVLEVGLALISYLRCDLPDYFCDGSTIESETALIILNNQKDEISRQDIFFTVVAFDRNYTKDQVIEIYVNEYIFEEEIRGFPMASQHYFETDIEDLNEEGLEFLLDKRYTSLERKEI